MVITTLAMHVLNIILLRSNVHVVGINAGGDVTLVAKYQPIWYRPNKLLVKISVGSIAPAVAVSILAHRYNSVSPCAFLARINPASVGVDFISTQHRGSIMSVVCHFVVPSRFGVGRSGALTPFPSVSST